MENRDQTYLQSIVLLHNYGSLVHVSKGRDRSRFDLFAHTCNTPLVHVLTNVIDEGSDVFPNLLIDGQFFIREKTREKFNPRHAN